MKIKSKKFAEAQAAQLAVQITRRESAAAASRADLARVMFKKARKAYKAARKASKRAAKRAKDAQKQLAPLVKFLKPAKGQRVRKPQVKGAQPKAKPAATVPLAGPTNPPAD